MRKSSLIENEQGAIYRYDKINNSLFNFYAQRKRVYKDGTALWHLGVELVSDTSKSMVIEKMRGTKKDAVKRLDEIVRTGTL